MKGPLTDTLNKKQGVYLIFKIFIIESDMFLILKLILNRAFNQMLTRSRVDPFHMQIRMNFLVMVHFAGFNMLERVIILM